MARIPSRRPRLHFRAGPVDAVVLSEQLSLYLSIETRVSFVPVPSGAASTFALPRWPR